MHQKKTKIYIMHHIIIVSAFAPPSRAAQPLRRLSRLRSCADRLSGRPPERPTETSYHIYTHLIHGIRYTYMYIYICIYTYMYMFVCILSHFGSRRLHPRPVVRPPVRPTDGYFADVHKDLSLPKQRTNMNVYI